MASATTFAAPMLSTGAQCADMEHGDEADIVDDSDTTLLASPAVAATATANITAAIAAATDTAADDADAADRARAMRELLRALGLGDAITPAALARALTTAHPTLLPVDTAGAGAAVAALSAAPAPAPATGPSTIITAHSNSSAISHQSTTSSTSSTTSGGPRQASPRAHRYAATKVARALIAFFDPRAAAERQSSGRRDPSAAASPPQLPDVPPVARETLAFLRLVGADAAVGKQQLDREDTIVRLGEIVLCAALHSNLRNEYVDAVMSLPEDMQDCLADAVHRVANGYSDPLDTARDDQDRHSAVADGRVHDDPENDYDVYDDDGHDDGDDDDDNDDNNDYDDDGDDHLNTDSRYSTDCHLNAPVHSKRADDSIYNPATGYGHRLDNDRGNGPHALQSSSSHHQIREVVDTGMENQEQNVSGNESSGPTSHVGRRKLVNDVHVVAGQPYPHVELVQPVNQAIPMSAPSAVLRESTADNLQHAPPRYGAGRKPAGQRPHIMKVKGTRGQDASGHVNAEAAELRERVLALEHELRLKSSELAAVSAQAVAAKQTAIASSKTGPATVRNAAVTDVPDIEILRAKAASADTLEVSLKCATARLEQAGEIRRHAAELENQNVSLRDGEQRLQKRVAYLESQLDSNISRSETLIKMSEGLSAELQAREAELASCRLEHANAKHELDDAKAQIANLLGSAPSPTLSHRDLSSPGPRVLDTAAVSAALERELGVVMSWDDVVECVRGVVEAMREMDEAEAAQRRAAEETCREEDALLNNKRARASEETSTDAYMSRHDPSDSGEYLSVTASGTNRMPTLRDFIDVDEHMEATGRPGDDDFDFAADQANVKEHVVQFEGSVGREEDKGVSPRFLNAAPLIPRRRSSTPSLPTVPENYEGFVGEAACHDADSCDSQNGSAGDSAECGAQSPSFNLKESGSDTGNIFSLERAECHRPSPTRGTPATITTSQASLTRSDGAVQRIVGVFEDMDMGDRGLVRADTAIADGATENRASTRAQGLDLIAKQLAEQTAISQAKERECAELRHELSLLIKEVDGVIAQRDSDAQHEGELVAEKERLVEHLQRALASCTEELSSTKVLLVGAREQVEALRGEADKLRDDKLGLSQELVSSNRRLEEQMREHQVVCRTQQVDIVELRRQLAEASSLLPSSAPSSSSALPMSHEGGGVGQHDGIYRELLEAARREKCAAELIREELREAAKLQSVKLAEIHRSAVEAAADREYNVDMRLSKARKSTRFGALMRRLAHRDAVSEYDTMLTLRPIPREEDAFVSQERPSRLSYDRH